MQDFTDPQTWKFGLVAMLAVFLVVVAAVMGSLREWERKKELRRIREAMERQSPPRR